MMRRWGQSASRARRYAAPGIPRRARAGVALRFVWLRRAAGNGRGHRIALQARLDMAIALHVQTRERRSPDMARDAVAARAHRELIRHEWSTLPIVRLPSALPSPGARTETTRLAGVASHDRLATRVLHERLVHGVTAARLALTMVTGAVVLRERRVTEHRQLMPASFAAGTPQIASRSRASSQAQVTRIQPPLVQRFGSVHRSLTSTTTFRRTAFPRVPSWPRERAEQAPPSPAAAAPLPLEVVERRSLVRMAAMRAFSAQPQPFAAPATRPAAAESVPVERIERTLRESLTVVAERTVRRELDRTLRPGAPLNRRLRESIQSEMYDDIVFERERRGER